MGGLLTTTRSIAPAVAFQNSLFLKMLMAAAQRVTDACNLVQGSCAAGVDVSCSTSQPKSPDRIAGIKKPRRNAEANFTNWYVTIIFMPPLKVKAAYQSRLKYDVFNPVLQDLSLNLSPFVVNVIALPAKENRYQGAARWFSSPPTAL